MCVWRPNVSPRRVPLAELIDLRWYSRLALVINLIDADSEGPASAPRAPPFSLHDVEGVGGL